MKTTKERSILVGVIATMTDKYGVHYSLPTYSAQFYLESGRIKPERDEGEEPEATYHYEMLMPSGVVVPIHWDFDNDCYVVSSCKQVGLSYQQAKDLYSKNTHEVYMTYDDGTESLVDDEARMDQHYAHGGKFCYFEEP